MPVYSRFLKITEHVCYNKPMKLPSALYIFCLLLIVILGSLTAWLMHPLTSTAAGSVSSPLPDVLTRFFNQQVTSLDLWTVHPSPNSRALELSAKSALSYDLTTNKVLFAKNPQEKLPMASLTKIMTAIVALEHQRSDNAYTVTQSDLVGEDSMGLAAGETLKLEDLLYGLILHSGNDAAETFASNFPGGRSAFINAMNEKAQSLGLTHTHFTNPTGLEGDGNQYTTAQDLVVMTRFALLHFPLFGTVAATFDHTIPATSTHQEYDLENETNLLTSYPGVKGVKTGFTPEAGLCLVTFLDYNGHQILAVILGSDDRRGEMKDILDYSLRSEGITPPHHD